ncbi:MAG: Na/Pi cotransporter family protein, partial [Muribaculaceae bacterium]
QSSAATFAITLIMCSKGWITFDLACALVLGSNIGTTITPILASLSGNVAAKRTAMGHLLFNFLGTVWTLAVFYPFVNLNCWITQTIGQGDPNALYTWVNGLQASNPEVYSHLFDGTLSEKNEFVMQMVKMQVSVSFGLSVFHTVFNVINLSVMIWLTNVYVKIVEWIMPAKHKEDEEFTLKFISAGILSASELNITQAEKEIYVYTERVQRMINMAHELVHTEEDSDDFVKLYSRLEKYEDISDRMEIEIADYLNRCAEGRLSAEGKLHIAGMLRIVSEVESIADCCLGVGKIMLRKIDAKARFNDAIYQHIDSMFALVKDAMTNMMGLLRNFENPSITDINASYNKEREINNMRNRLRSANIENINERHYEYQAGIYFMDLVSDLERTGDYIINVVDTMKEDFSKEIAD